MISMAAVLCATRWPLAAGVTLHFRRLQRPSSCCDIDRGAITMKSPYIQRLAVLLFMHGSVIIRGARGRRVTHTCSKALIGPCGILLRGSDSGISAASQRTPCRRLINCLFLMCKFGSESLFDYACRPSGACFRARAAAGQSRSGRGNMWKIKGLLPKASLAVPAVKPATYAAFGAASELFVGRGAQRAASCFLQTNA
jgi:hypothetical protein